MSRYTPASVEEYQVWSLTQFYSVDFSKSRMVVKKCVFNKRTIKVCVSCCWRCPGTSAPSAAHLTVSLYLCSSGSNARGESRALEGRRVSSKSPSRVRDGDEGVAGRNVRERIIFSKKAKAMGSKNPKFWKLTFFGGQTWFFDQKTRNFEISDFLVARPGFLTKKAQISKISIFWAQRALETDKKAKNQKKRQGECATTPLLPPHPHSVQYLHHLHIPTSPTVLNTLCPSSLPSPTSPTIQHCT